MLVTIISDASHCPKTLAGGYGCWIACNRGSAAYGGPLNDARDSGEIEAKAACNALHMAISNGFIKRKDTILIQIDCDSALRLFQGTTQPREREKEVVAWLRGIIERNDLTVRYRHVKGHTSNMDSRSVAQDKCDKLAKQYMRQERGKRMCKELREQHKASKPKKVKKVSKPEPSLEDTWARKLKLLVRGQYGV